MSDKDFRAREQFYMFYWCTHVECLGLPLFQAKTKELNMS